VTVEDHKVDEGLIRQIADEELARLEGRLGPDAFALGRFEEARRLLEQLVFSLDFPEFLTIPAYELID
jgi:malate synthase